MLLMTMVVVWCVCGGCVWCGTPLYGSHCYYYCCYCMLAVVDQDDNNQTEAPCGRVCVERGRVCEWCVCVFVLSRQRSTKGCPLRSSFIQQIGKGCQSAPTTNAKPWPPLAAPPPRIAQHLPQAIVLGAQEGLLTPMGASLTSSTRGGGEAGWVGVFWNGRDACCQTDCIVLTPADPKPQEPRPRADGLLCAQCMPTLLWCRG